jgi:plasmid stabilization system protein ParE
MSLEVILTHTAVETYDAIFEQITLKFGSNVSDKFQDKVFKTLKTISKSPLIFKATTENQNIRKGYINKNCSFFYEVTAKQIHILFFWDNRQEPLIS